MSTSSKSLQCVVVTPEEEVFSETCDFVVVPLYDGEAGIYPDRAPIIARLGYGELRISVAGELRRYYIDGGFLQVQDNVVSILTARIFSGSEIDSEQVRTQLEDYLSQLKDSTDSEEAKERVQLQLRGQLTVASRSGN